MTGSQVKVKNYLMPESQPGDILSIACNFIAP